MEGITTNSPIDITSFHLRWRKAWTRMEGITTRNNLSPETLPLRRKAWTRMEGITTIFFTSFLSEYLVAESVDPN